MKVSLLAWRLFRNRLSTKDNLFIRGIIQQDSQLCMGGCEELESTNHLFSKCSFFNFVLHVYNWIGISTMEPYSIFDHIVQFFRLSHNNKIRRSILQIIWFSSIKVIWKEQNSIIVIIHEEIIHNPVDKIKVLSFW